ncbi:transposase [Oleidesulfovibrio sp.]|uniref:transposase n=1 Tax=Oleidesulfovibrio sp. TaxID=2909707 RepID=UPI003A851388
MSKASRQELLQSEEAALAYVLAECWPGGLRFCPRCGEDKLYDLAGGRARCARCKYTFQDFSGRWINNGGLSPQTWLRLADLFESEPTVHQMAVEAGLSYNATYKAVTTMRFAILAHAPDAVQLLGPETGLGNFLRNRKLTGDPEASSRLRGTVPVFGIMERSGRLFIDLVSGMSAETIFHFNHSFHLKVERAGNLVWTDRYRHYDALVFCGDDSLPYEYLRRHDRPVAVESGQGFWAFAEKRLKMFKGITPRRFPLYLKELEFRYNIRHGDLFPVLVRYLCDFVPETTPEGVVVTASPQAGAQGVSAIG